MENGCVNIEIKDKPQETNKEFKFSKRVNNSQNNEKSQDEKK